MAQARFQQDADMLVVQGIQPHAARPLGPHQVVFPQHPQLVGDR